jgi:UDP-N-acetylmuramate dehydrogenase
MESGRKLFGKPMKIIEKPDLTKLSTLKMGGTALAAYYLQDYRDLEDLAKIWPELGPEILIMGRGSNILFQDGTRQLCIIAWDKDHDPAVIKEIGDKFMILADAGISLPGLLRWCSGRGFSGIEQLAGIPGSLGGAIAMNAGSYGFETRDVLSSLTVWTPDSGIMELDMNDFEFGYRTLRLNHVSGPFIILKASLFLKKDDPKNIRARIRKYYFRKKSTQPILEKTAGCVFKNPVGFEPAGVLLEKAGFRGKTKGRVCFSPKHSNFLVNMDRGSSQSAMELISEARQEVQRIFGAKLELEIKVI